MSVSLTPAAEADIPVLARIIALAFAGTIDGVTKWLVDNGIDNLRVLRDGAAIPACLRRVDMGQYFGEKRVGMMGIAGVGTSPEHRGRGYARRMMEMVVREALAEGLPLAGLYASTQALYRQSGFEQAGHRFVTKIPVARLAGVGKARRVVTLTDADLPRVEKVYRAYAALWPGMLDRTAYVWSRIRKMRDSEYQGFGVLDDAGELGGYLYLTQQRDEASGRHDLAVSDLAFTSAEHGKALIGFLGDFEPMANHVVLGGGPLHPLATLLPQQRYEVKLKDYWMLRVVSVARALEARGYSRAVRGAVTLSVRDELITDNAGEWKVEIENGAARVSAARLSAARGGGGGGGKVSCDVKGLAAMYSGLYTPRQAAVLGLCEGDEAGFDVLGAAFAGGTPWMTDHY